MFLFWQRMFLCIALTACAHQFEVGQKLEASSFAGLRAPAATSQTLDEFMAQEKPLRMAKDLPEESYVPFTAKRLKKAKVLWVNFAALREMNIAIPSEGLTPEFEKSILDQFAYMVPNKSDDSDGFVDSFKTFYADRYGGTGIGYNGGSGRAGTSGPLQVKNIGRTPLVSEFTEFSHNHGGGSIKEAVQEAVWGEVANTELPQGANRVLFILDTGTFTHWEDGTLEKRSLIVRQDPLRAAHFIDAPGYSARLGQLEDTDRVRAALNHLIDALPASANDNPAADEATQLLTRIDAMYELQIEQMAYAHAKKIFHGAMAPSNIEANGRYLDYASVTATAGYVDQYADQDRFPTMTREIEWIHKSYNELYSTLKRSYPRKEALVKLREVSTMNSRLNLLYERELKKAFLEQLGFPRSYVFKTAHENSARDLGDAVLKLLKHDQVKRVHHNDDFAKLKLHARLEEVLHDSLNDLSQDVELAGKSLAEKLDIPVEEAQNLVSLTRGYFLRLADLAKNEGVSSEGLRKGILLRSPILNRNMPELYREAFKREIIAKVDVYAQSKDRSMLWNYIDAKMRSNKRGFNSLLPNAVVITEDIDFLSGTTRQLVFDEVHQVYKVVIAAPIVDGEVYWHMHRIPVSEFDGLKLRAGIHSWKKTEDVIAKNAGRSYLFEIPVGISPPQNIEYVLGNSDGSHWWKNGDSNFHMSTSVDAVPVGGSCSDSVSVLLGR